MRENVGRKFLAGIFFKKCIAKTIF